MKILNKKACIQVLSLIIIFVNCDQKFVQISSELEYLFDTIFQQIQIHEVILMYTTDNNNKYNPMESLIARKVVSRYPTKNWNFHKLILKNTDKSGKIKQLALNRTTILFINILKINELAYKAKEQFLKRLRAISLDTFISKFLIFILNDKEEMKFEKFFKLAWKNELIDIFIHEIIIRSNKEGNKNIFADTKCVDFRKRKGYSQSILYNSIFTNIIHSFNPFTEVYHREPFNNKTILFPDKIRNLYKYKLRIGVVDYPPYSDVRKTTDGKMQFYAPGGELIKSLIKHINFTIVPEIGSLSQYGILLPNGSATGLLARIKNNKLDAIAFGAFVFHTSYITEVDRTMYLNLERICAVVPLIRSKRLYIQRSVWISCITIICLVILVWLFSFILRPHGTFSWNLLHISLIVLGISVPGQPTILRERFVYGSVIVVAFLYSSSIFAQLMSINFHATSFKSFNSLEELNESGLIPVLHPNLYNLTFKFGNKILQSMGAKSVLRSDYSEICPIWLWEKANVTCVIGSTMYDFLSKLYRDNPKRVMKLASPCFWSASRALILRKASPYTHRFSTIILRVIEAGHMKRATNLYVFDFIQRRNISQESDETLSEKRMAVNVQQMTYSDVTDAFAVMLIGTLFSICFLLGECVIFNVRSRYKRKSIALVRY